ncbi:hypothetical protein FHR84_003103 [Actinopolyspora biskrensis]|uniref:Fibronectin type-III domain-containing protein n=1 Tax=Actinopolyspora biskrensis TaxID=1470178 RepID=A0A852Z3A7_9ACTN|nr:delta-60 repeat domain-containing protein [Actinopolyspora biskrensis]NYH79765.1 hypothetical protein [Actinopolyspora biskrensis]
MLVARRRGWRAVLTAGIAAGAVLLPGVATTKASAAEAAESTPTPVTAGSMPTPQTNGTIFSVTIVGDTAYAGGMFTKARPDGVAPGGDGEVTRHNLLAFDLDTGELLPWTPEVAVSQTLQNYPGPYCREVEGPAWACDSVFQLEASPDGSELYVVGDFDQVNGEWRSRIARFDTASRELDPNFDPRATGRVRGLSATENTVYFGGAFDAVDGTARQRLAAVDTDGSLTSWNPSVDNEVFTVQAAPAQQRVLLGGAFNAVNGEQRRAMMAVDDTSGANVSWQARVPAGSEVVTDIATDSTGTAYFGAYDHSNNEVRFEGRTAIDIATGEADWWDGCYGDTQGVAVADGILYSASHTHDCAAMDEVTDDQYYRLLAETTTATETATATSNHVEKGDPVPGVLPWFPNTDQGPAGSAWQHGPWAVDATSEYVLVGGEFTTVNGKDRQSLALFGARDVPGSVDNGPKQALLTSPDLSRDADGNVTITWNTTWSAQTTNIRYEVIRRGADEPIHTVTQRNRPWNTPRLSYTDTEHTAGTYRIRAVDTDGNAIGSPSTTISASED